MKIGKFSFGMRGHDLADTFEDMCKTAQKVNIRRLQFAPIKTMQDIDFLSIGYDENIAKGIIDEFDKHGLKTSVLGCYIDPITQETLEAQHRLFKNFILYAKALKAAVIGTETGWFSDIEETHSDKNYSRFIKSIEKLLPIAEENGVNIGIEPVWTNTVYSVEMMKKVLDYFKSDNLCVIFDPINLINIDNYLYQNQIIDNAIEMFGDKIKSLHLKDYIYSDGVIKRVPVGTGRFDIKYCLNKIGKLKDVPDVMLDEMPLADLESVTGRLKRII